MNVQMRVALPVILPALGISLLLGIVCIMGVRSLNRLQSERSRLLARDVASLEAAQEVEVRLRQLRFHSFVYIHDPTPVRKAVIDDDHAQVEAALRKIREATDRPEELEIVLRIEEGYRAYLAKLDDRSQWPGPGANRFNYLAWADAHPSSPLLAVCDELLALNRSSMERSTRANAELTGQTRWMMVVLGILGPLAGLISGAGIAWSFGRAFARLQLRIDDTHAELLRSEQMAAVGHLAAGVAHEVRNPLTGAKLLIEAALRPESPQPLVPEELRMILGEIGRVERTVQGLLDFAKPTGLSRCRIDLAASLQTAIDSCRARAAIHGVRIAFTPPEIPMAVFADADQLAAAISNLLINSIEASPTGADVHIGIFAHRADMIDVVVRDRGPGISAAMFDRLFTPFATDKPTGTGLGLCVARRTAREQGGDLTAENDPSGGARFTLRLPRMRAGHAETVDRR